MSDPRHDLVRDLSTAAAKASPPVAVTLWAWLGENLPTAVAMATLVYILLQIGHLIFVWQRQRRGFKVGSDESAE